MGVHGVTLPTLQVFAVVTNRHTRLPSISSASSSTFVYIVIYGLNGVGGAVSSGTVLECEYVVILVCAKLCLLFLQQQGLTRIT